MAGMDHPAIAKIFEVAASKAGRPYFVMELVNGKPITEFCDRRKLSVKQRLQLFRQVCMGVQHAHQKGVIHRDLKPSNILVAAKDGSPQAKVIDFGVAKAIHPNHAGESITGELWTNLGTPQYMSPEQANGKTTDVDTRSDIYSLGVVLFEILTGQTPISRELLRREGPAAVSQAIQNTEPPHPSSCLRKSISADDQVDARSRDRFSGDYKQLRGDVDAIVLKALEKDRSRRYQTVDELANDIQRHLSGDPVQARPAGVSYRIQKIARKHRVAVGIVATVVLGLIAALIASMIAISHIEQERRVAAAERDKARKALQVARQLVNDVIVPSSSQTYQLPQVAEVSEDVLLTSVDFYEQLCDLSGNDPQLRLELSKLLRTRGRQANRLGNSAVATHERSVSLLDELAKDYPDNRRVRAELATSYASLAQGHMVDLRWTDAERCERLATEIIEHLSKQSLDPEFRSRLPDRQCAWAVALYHTGRFASAEAVFSDALPFIRKTNAFRFVSSGMAFAGLLVDAGRLDESESLLREVLEFLDPEDDSQAQEDVLLASLRVKLLSDLGQLNYYGQRLDEARSRLSEALELGYSHAERWRFTYRDLVIASTLQCSSECFILQGRHREAETCLRDTLSIVEKPGTTGQCMCWPTATPALRTFYGLRDTTKPPVSNSNGRLSHSSRYRKSCLAN